MDRAPPTGLSAGPSWLSSGAERLTVGVWGWQKLRGLWSSYVRTRSLRQRCLSGAAEGRGGGGGGGRASGGARRAGRPPGSRRCVDTCS